MTDLHRILNDLQDAAAEGAGQAPLEQLLRRRWRRRAVQRAGVSAASVAAVTAILVTGGVLMDRGVPSPPAVTPSPSPSPTAPTPTPTPEPTETPGPAPVVLPTGDPSLPLGECGSLMASEPALPPAGPLGISWGVDRGTAAPGDSVQVTANVTDEGGAVMRVLPSTGPRVLVVRDGVVVGAGGLFADSGAPVAVGGPMWDAGVLGLADLVVCDPGAADPAATGGAPLPEDDFQLWAFAPEVTWVEAELFDEEDLVRAVLDHPDARQGSVLSEPIEIRLEGAPAEGPRPAAEDAREVTFPEPTGFDLPACGGPAPEVSDGMLRIEHPPGPLTPGADGRLGTEATLRYVGPGRIDLFPGNYLEYSVVQDGVVVAEFQDPGSDGGSLRMRHGTGLTRPEAGVLVTCAEPDTWSTTLPPGRYQLYPSIYARPYEVVLVDGTRVGYTADTGAQIYGAPVELVVD